MKNAIQNLINRRRSVSSIVSSMEKQVDRLLATAQYQIERAIDKEAEMFELERQAHAHREEADRAFRIAERFGNLVR